MEQLIGNLTEKQVSIDGILAQALLASAEPKFMRKYLKSSNSHMMDGKYSGLKIIQTFSKVINKKPHKGSKKAYLEAINRPSVTEPTLLYSALQQAERDIDNLIQQGGEADEQLRFAILTQMTEKFVLMPSMTKELTLPMHKSETNHPNDPEHLYTSVQCAPGHRREHPARRRLRSQDCTKSDGCRHTRQEITVEIQG